MARKSKPWYLLSSHGLVLVTVARFRDLTVMEIAGRTGLSRGTVLRALRELQAARMLEVRRQGRRNTYCVKSGASFRHPVIQDIQIAELLKAFPPLETS